MGESRLTKMGYELESIHIVQTPISYVDHRSECDTTITLCGRKVNPVIVAPMGAVTNEHNYKTWLDNGFICVVPRTVDVNERLKISEETFASFSLNESEKILTKLSPDVKRYICIDIAHGTMNRLYTICKKLKKKFHDNIVIMTGNVANPEAYSFYADAGIDYMRACIGTGSRCVCEGTLVTMADGSKQPIEDVNVGDYVQTINGPQKVVNTFSKETRSTITINNVECTPDHKFFVIKKSDVTNNMTDDDIRNKGQYIEAKNLTDEYLLVGTYPIKLIEITNISKHKVKKLVYDIEVENEHNYIANSLIVHNCTTSCNVGVHYPTATLIDELRQQKEAWEESHEGSSTEIIVDGGISNFDDIQKCLGLGAFAVMSGSIFARAYEACEEIVYLHKDNLNMADAITKEDWDKKIEFFKDLYNDPYYHDAYEKLLKRKPYRNYWGMSTKKAQKETGGAGTKTAEGIIKPIPVEYPIAKWSENMRDYVASAMSYIGVTTIQQMRKETEFIINLSGDSSFRK